MDFIYNFIPENILNALGWTVENRCKGNVTINGNEIKGLKDGDRTVIVEELEGDDLLRRYYDKANAYDFWFSHSFEPHAIPFPESPAIADYFKRQKELAFPDTHWFEKEESPLFEEQMQEWELHHQELLRRYKDSEKFHQELLHKQEKELHQLLNDQEKWRGNLFEHQHENEELRDELLRSREKELHQLLNDQEKWRGNLFEHQHENEELRDDYRRAQ